MTTKLQQYFPLIREREEILKEIQEKPELQNIYVGWTEKQQQEFLDFTTGVRGIKFLYDGFFKELMNPETTPERLEELLSLLLGIRVRILQVLPTDSTRIADESSLLVMDIVVQLESGEIVNLEIQKIGYKFPGERSACYSSDLLLRQYKRVRSTKNEKFSYKDIKGVYTVVLFENSPKEFKKYSDVYLHYFQQNSNTGLELELLQKYLFIPLDIFKEKLQNKGRKRAENKLEAWLLFLSDDDPETVIQLIEDYPEFRKLYEERYQICRNIEEVMQMFSEELKELDRNTVQLMIDEMQEEIDGQRGQIESQNEIIENQQKQIEEKERLLEEEKLAKFRMVRRSYEQLRDMKKVADLCGISMDEAKQILDSEGF